MSLRDLYTLAAVSMRFGASGTYCLMLPVGSGRDCWNWMRFVARAATPVPPQDLGRVAA
jgi:hypothetical protein